jgi:hypothetical protein
MATSRLVSHPLTELTLSATEATWLKAVLQNPILRNPIGGIEVCGPLEEDPFDKRIRQEIFNCLRFT